MLALFWGPQEEVAKAWRIDPLEPIIIRLHFSLSQYLDGPGEPQNAVNVSVQHFDIWLIHISHHSTFSWSIPAVHNRSFQPWKTAAEVSDSFLLRKLSKYVVQQSI